MWPLNVRVQSRNDILLFWLQIGLLAVCPWNWDHSSQWHTVLVVWFVRRSNSLTKVWHANVDNKQHLLSQGHCSGIVPEYVPRPFYPHHLQGNVLGTFNRKFRGNWSTSGLYNNEEECTLAGYRTPVVQHVGSHHTAQTWVGLQGFGGPETRLLKVNCRLCTRIAILGVLYGFKERRMGRSRRRDVCDLVNV